jgi:hypothetical protein
MFPNNSITTFIALHLILCFSGGNIGKISFRSPSARLHAQCNDYSDKGFNPFNFFVPDSGSTSGGENHRELSPYFSGVASGIWTASAVSLQPSSAAAAPMKDIFDPAQFQPVCPTSDTVYQVLKGTSSALVGQSNAEEYGPLIASVLLRIRLELCVLESFIYEAVVPFIQKKGISWVFPLHETVETFLAGTIFAVASNFILLSSTKIVAVLFIYADTLTGMPSRAIGNGIKKVSQKASGGDIFGSVLKAYGDVMGFTRSVVENVDVFVGRYLVLATSFYIAFKFAHFKFFNDVF